MISYKSIDKDLDWLRKISKRVDIGNEDISKDVALLKEFCKQEEVFAMAAIQLGIDKRIVYVKNTDLDKVEDKEWDEDFLLINPVILEREGLVWYWEACRSCLDNMGLMFRPYRLIISYYDIDGVSHEKEFVGFPAVVLSHELDHLDGILHIDKSLKIYDIVQEERKEFRETHPYHIFYKTGDFLSLEQEYTEKYKNHLLDELEENDE